MKKKTRFLKDAFFILILVFSLTACAPSNIYQVEKKWGPPAKVEQINGHDVYYWHFYKGSGSVWGNKLIFVNYSEGWITYEFTADEDGTILNKRKYWKQPNSN